MADHNIMSQIEVLPVTDTGRRHRWTDTEKLPMVEESYAAPRRVAATARRYEISRSFLTRWRREAREGLLAADGDRSYFVPVSVTPAPAPGPVAADVRNPAVDTGCDRVEIILPNGRRLVTSATTKASVLARLIQIVERA